MTDDTEEAVRLKLTSENPVQGCEEQQPITIVETVKTDQKTEMRSDPVVAITSDPVVAITSDPVVAITSDPVVAITSDPVVAITSDPVVATTSDLVVTEIMDSHVATKPGMRIEKLPPSHLRRKLNAVSILLVHDLLLIGIIGYYLDGFSWLIHSRTGLFHIIGAFQLVIVSWLMLPSTTWRVRGVALYLSIGLIWLGAIGFMLTMYGFAYFKVQPPWL